MERLKKDYAAIKDGSYPLSIVHLPGATIRELTSKIRAWAYKSGARNGAGIICVDYLQLVHVDGQRGENAADKLKRISDGLAELGYQLDLPIVAALQFRNEAESVDQDKNDPWRTPYHIGLIDGGGRPAQSCEGLLILDLLKRRRPKHPANPDGTHDALVVVAEQRSGVGGGQVKCHADLRTSRFSETEQTRQDDFPF